MRMFEYVMVVQRPGLVWSGLVWSGLVCPVPTQPNRE